MDSSKTIPGYNLTEKTCGSVITNQVLCDLSQHSTKGITITITKMINTTTDREEFMAHLCQFFNYRYQFLQAIGTSGIHAGLSKLEPLLIGKETHATTQNEVT